MQSYSKLPLLWLEDVNKSQMPKDYFLLKSPESIHVRTIRIGIPTEEGSPKLSVFIRVRRKGSLSRTIYKIEFYH